jgi:hypothetical protein
MLVDHPASGLVLLAAVLAAKGVPSASNAFWFATFELVRPIPDPVGRVLWQARQRALLELLIARKLGLFGSVFCTCGLWQLVHSTFPLMSRTAPVLSAVAGGRAVNDETKSLLLVFSGRLKLTGCMAERFVPNTSAEFILPLMET